MPFSRFTLLAFVVLVSFSIAFIVFGNPWQTPQQLHARSKGIDSFLIATLLQQITIAVSSNPLAYYDLPILYPEVVPIRGTDPFIPYVPIFTLLMLINGGDAAIALTLMSYMTIVFLAVFTYAALRTLGVLPIIAAMAGIASVALQWWLLFSDRIQIITLFWYPLVLLLLAIWLMRRSIIWLVAVGLALTCLVLSTLYFTLMLTFAGIVLSPAVGAHLWRHRKSRELQLGLLACGLAAILAFLLILPWHSHRWDAGAYTIPDYMERKDSNAWEFGELFHRQAEMKQAVLSLPTTVEESGSFPGFAFLLFCGVFLWQRISDFRKSPDEPRDNKRWMRRIRAVCGWGWCIWALGGSFVLPGESTPLLIIGDMLFWTWLGSWIAMLALQNFDWSNSQERNPWLSQAFAICGILFLFITLGSPARLFAGTSPVSNGVYSVAAFVLPPFSLTRDLMRFIVPGGWFIVMAIGLSRAGLNIEKMKRSISLPILLIIGCVAIVEVLGVSFGDRNVPEIFPEYSLLNESTGSGGLLELPYYRWTHIHSIRRMYWQPQHGRPISDGYTGYMPAWRGPAMAVYNGFPSAQCLALLRKWNIDSVLAEPAHAMAPAPYTDGIHLRGQKNGWRLYDLDLDKLPQLEHPPIPAGTREITPIILHSGEYDPERTALLCDGDTGFNSKVTLTKNQWMVFRSKEKDLKGIVLDFGYGAFFKIPEQVIVEARTDHKWIRIDDASKSRFIGARCADLLINSQFARVYIPVGRTDATTFRLKSKRTHWELPEFRLIVENAGDTK